MGEEEIKTIVVGPQGDVVNWVAAEMVARVEWVREKIADACYEPTPAPQSWAGRADIISTAMRSVEAGGLGLTSLEAASAVDLAVTDLWAADHADDLHVQRRLSMMRLRAMRQLVLKSMQDGCVETTYGYEPHPTEEGKLVERRLKEKRYRGITMAQVGMLKDIELAMEQLAGMHDRNAGSDTNILARMMEQWKRMREGGPATTKVDDIKGNSLAARLRNAPLDQLPAAGQERIAEMVHELGAPPAPKKRGRKKKGAEGE